MDSLLCSKKPLSFFSTKFSATLLLLFLTTFAFAQNGSIKGRVETSDGKPAEFVNISLQGTTKGATVSKNGHYSINNIAPGTYTLVASFTGLGTQNRQVTVTSGNTSTENFTLTESNQRLQEVVVSSGKVNKFTRKGSQDVAKLPLSNLENPQIYSVVTSDVMKEQQVVNISQALANVPGAVPSKDPAGGTSITLRGFTAEVAARNGVQFIGAGRSGVDPVNIDHFEVLKGPSAVLFGNVVSSYGGAINMVTKKPFDTFKGEVNYSMGTFGLSRATVDINTPLNADKTVLLRTNAAVNREQSFLTTGHNNTTTFAPSLTFKASDKLTLQFDVEAYKEDLTKTPYLVFNALNVKNINQIPLDYKSVLYNDDLNAVASTLRTYFQANYKFNEHWYSQTNISVNNERVEHSYQYYPTFTDATHIDRSIALYGPITTINSDIQHNLHGDFNIGGLRNRFVWGLDYTHTRTDFTYDFADVDLIDITKPYTPVTKPIADAALQASTPGMFLNNVNQYATYASDLVNLTDNLMVLLSARVDRYQLQGTDGYSQTSVTPKFGLIYQPIKDRISLFGNYMSGFTNNGPAVQPDGTTVVLKPEFARQLEGGVKLDVVHGLVSASLSYYQINIDNSVRYENNFALQDGTQKSQGVEASVTANPAPGLNLLAGYVYNKNQYTRAASGVGKDVTGTPRNVANVWASYKFQPGNPLADVGFGAGANYSEKSYYDLNNTIVIPSFVLFNASVFYDQAKWRFGISGSNLGNKRYYSPSFTANPQQLRQLIASITFKF
ncbi:iron complex outermembrane receptor protein [Mucilaginibacter yixingensis]|uniref:Iron complex outermembrane receptor protein n=1 Tax=Mucilaginibacter yixingensis TaxID=1295612 RepID=A0A2T5JBD7_9SPHI|nr:TonB-dependent receptor [Mucilaginibacter yixingensis]PTQ98180.1 iron complex outermembrane receptor protein [Mucilaginibacter yixingensis]